MKRLHLLRHAKSSWSDATLADAERPLSGRGRRAARAMGAHLRETDVVCDLVLCSPTQRTRETLERLGELPAAAPVRLVPEINGAGGRELLALLRGLPDDVESVLLVGHHPGMRQLALTLARASDRRDDLAVKFPTGAFATLELRAARWADVARGGGELTAFVRPRDLTDELPARPRADGR